MSSEEISFIRKKIGKYTFQLANLYRDLLNGRSILVIFVDGSDVEHTVLRFYKSLSEGGFWRLCTSTYGRSGHLYKGSIDYVQQTLMHLDLQKFVNETDLTSITRDTTITDDMMFCKSVEYYKTHIDDPSRIIRIDLFDGITPCGNYDGLMTRTIEQIKEELSKLSPILEEKFVTYKPYFYSDYHYENKFHSRMVTIDGKIYNMAIKYNDMYLELSVLKYNFKVKDVNTNVIRIDYTDKIIPIQLVGITNEITKFGLNSTYVPAQFFICKIMDYIDQHRDIRDLYPSHIINIDYGYIGNILDEMPFMQKINRTIPSLLGGYYNKYLKYKAKYLKLKNLNY